jgi:superfamily II DNA/RNA helicase
MHGNKTQNQRQRSLEQFRNGRVNILIATDIASRGIDVKDITHVINYDLPESYEAYIHRIGRTARASKKGTALTFIS